jgi:hypothetical protein
MHPLILRMSPRQFYAANTLSAPYFSGFVDFVGAHPHYALTAVFLLALSEAIPVIGTVVPGSTVPQLSQM